MSLDISFEYLNTIDDLDELYRIEKVIHLEKGQLSQLDAQVRCVKKRLKNEKDLKNRFE